MFRSPQEAIEEAASLARALPELDLVGFSTLQLARYYPGTIFSPDRVEELHAQMDANEIDLLLIDGPVSPVQQRNLEKAWKLKLLDRTALILEIFSDRARTREGVLQVEMAALSYQRTRLVRAWTHLERQRGGLGFVGGPGETQIEADRRAIDTQLTRLRRQLEKVVKTRTLHREARAKVPFPIVALVGYTNAGKSTLFNRMTGSDVLAKDMLFATLDPTMRQVTLSNGLQVILSDTVGFISDLPTQLVASFRATLEEVTAADIVVHVRNIAHAETQAQFENVEDILGDLGIEDDTPKIELWNQIDLIPDQDREALENQAARREDVFLTSAITGHGVKSFQDALRAILTPKTRDEDILIDFSDGKSRAWLFEHAEVLTEEAKEDGLCLHVRWSDIQARRYEKFSQGQG